MAVSSATFFLPCQARWLDDVAPLKIIEKSRQIGISYVTAYSAVTRAAIKGALFDVWVSSRDETQAKLFLEDCVFWANILQLAARDLGQVVFDRSNDFSAYVLEFANGRRIYSLSSNPNALAGKRGHVILDEFALHKDQRLLYRIAKPVTQWGGQLEIISTHRGVGSVFNEFIRDIREKNNPMGWSHHRITLEDAVNDGLVEKINAKKGTQESRADFLARTRRECIDEEQWLQEYCCIPADENTAFLTYEMITSCETPDVLKDFAYLLDAKNPLYIGFDVARTTHLSVIDVGEKIGDVMYDRLRLELRGKTFAEQKEELYRLLRLPQVRRCCIDASGLAMQLAEEAQRDFGYKVEGIKFTAQIKEDLAFPLRAAFEDRRLRIASSPALRADLRGIKKEVTASGNIRFLGESADSHCDRFWALALRQHAAGKKVSVGAVVFD